MKKGILWGFIVLISAFFFFGYKISKLKKQEVITGAQLTNEYIPYLIDKNVAVLANHSSLINNTHLVDSLLSLNINLVKIFSPEHGFRGDVDAGEYFSDYTDTLTGLQVISLYGKKFKPTNKQLKGIDIVVFDIQDVGVRFYTYISTLHYMMEACAENNIELVILDRPNPNGFYIDGPVLKIKHASFVGLHPIPLVYGLTIGELALMINGEKWLNNEAQCKLKVITCKNYTHETRYELPVNPSPNLQNIESVYLYPSLGLFEGTVMSIGRGTNSPFRVIGHPEYPDTAFSFTPNSILGVCVDPLFKNKKCYGLNLQNLKKEELSNLKRVNITLLIDCYKKLNDKVKFFNSYFNMLAGSPELRENIENNTPEKEIRANWKKDIDKYIEIRKNYLLYEDFTY